MTTRRRFLTITAAVAATTLAGPARAATARWTGRALGAEASLTLHGPAARTQPALKAAIDQIREVESLFSLFAPTSALSRLNRDGYLANPAPEMLRLFRHVGDIHRLTEGLFDPTVQPLWQAHARGGDPAQAIAALGWSRVHASAARITLAPGQALTFNGIAQGFATDAVTDRLRAHGLQDVHVNIGEHRVLGPARRLGLAGQGEDGAELLGHVTLQDAAIATSSPGAMRLAKGFHILAPHGGTPRWGTVSVVAETATLADGLSTALCLADLPLARRLRAAPGIHRILLADTAGDLITL
ncbi:FAD:protein FMN transferase [Aliishimia ponticola]|uniref:FAD:protein FMN transferase n=1 Tax=Aliishimia ponticola TaxID=2499833 RepID=A0A4S4N9H7_9RHOB|nr:FAD:protein FMN transferase [Aliishimia ponticola]THH35904.1 FAD:protein FMN transferase [Aliishimia ponticola]